VIQANDRRNSTVESSTLRARVFALERACADLRDESDLARAVLEANREIARIRKPALVVGKLLQTMRRPLGFGRAIYATVERARGVEAKCQIDEGDLVEGCDEQLDAREGSALLGVLRGENDGTGYAGELSAPLVDVRGWYVLCVLCAADGPFGVIYVDGHPSSVIRPREAELVHNLASVAAVAVENGTLLERTQELASRDPLTGLFNRRAFSERVGAIVSHAVALQRQFAYALIDVDDFKLLNDGKGHAHGDQILKDVAQTLLGTSRGDDVVGRYAGDEFVVLINNCDANLARSLVGRISASLRARDLRCSIGVALYPRDATGEHGLIEAADRALYNTKRAGKNGFSFY
jgi:diguanylate cyclase (GGDEF)-like protein